MRLHELRAAPDAFQAVCAGAGSPFVVRASERTFRAGDVLRLREWRATPGRLPGEAFTGGSALVLVLVVDEGEREVSFSFRRLSPFAPAGARTPGGAPSDEPRLRREASEQIAHLQRFKGPASRRFAAPDGHEATAAAAAHDAAVVALVRFALALEARRSRQRGAEVAETWQRVGDLERKRPQWTTSGDWRPASEAGFLSAVATLVREGYQLSQMTETAGFFRSALLHRPSDGAHATVTWEPATRESA